MRSMDRRVFVRSLSWLIAAALGVVLGMMLPVTASAGPGEDAPRPSRIVGVVFNSEHRPVAGAQVVLVTPMGEVVRRTETNAEGRYVFEPVRPGAWMVRARKADVGAGQARTFVRPGETVRVPVLLRAP